MPQGWFCLSWNDSVEQILMQIKTVNKLYNV